ncbi:MAG: hypothetical protein CMF52_02445 [Legionellales bacterium]|nr:hypothetical protein [Legionellales bacterium]
MTVIGDTKFLITGSRSGLGKYLFNRFGGFEWHRGTPEETIREAEAYASTVIIHCAFNSNLSLATENLYQYISDNLLFTQRLVSIPHDKLIFVSTVDVYPKDGSTHTEEEIINPDEVGNIYGVTKLMSEAIVNDQCENPIILRCSALLGNDSRPNSLSRMLSEKSKKLTLTSDSSFNYLLHNDLGDFVDQAVRSDLSGIFNLVSTENVTLDKLSSDLDLTPEYGSYRYDVGDITNEKAVSIFKQIDRTSLEVVEHYLATKNNS